MTRTPRTAGALVAFVGLALVAGACGSSKKSADNTTTTAGGSATTAAGGATTAPTTAAPATTTGGKAGGTINIHLPDKFTSYNNLTADDNLFSNQYVLNAVQPQLVYFNDKAEIVVNKDLLDSIDKTSDSPLTVVWKINPKAVWSDGEPLSCDDFRLAWVSQNGKAEETGADGKKAPLFSSATTTGFERIEKLDCSADGKTVTGTFSEPFSDWKAIFGAVQPWHVVAKQTGVTDLQKAYTDATGATPNTAELKKVADFWNGGFKTDKGLQKDLWLSAGPYVISDYQADQSVTLEKNPKFWGEAGKADKLVFRIISEDTAAVQALQNGEIDVITPQPDPDLLNQLEGLSGVKSSVEGGFTYEHFDFNFTNPLFQDKAVRQAVAYCLPRQDMIDKLIKPLNPDAKVMQNRMFFPFQKDYVDNSGGLYDKVDIAKAKSTLEAAGWKLNGSTYEKDGKKLEFKVLHKKNARRTQEYQLAQASCAQAGISMIDDGDDKWSARAGKGEFDTVFFAWVGSPLLSSQKALFITDGDSNYGKWSNKDADAFLSKLDTETDQAKLATAANSADKIIWDDLATIPIFQFPELLAYSDKVSGVSYNPTQQGITWNVASWTKG